MRQYEFVLVIRPTLEDEAVTAIVSQIETTIQRGGGEIVTRGQLIDKKGHIAEVVDGWSKRRMAYAIGPHREGYYPTLVFRAPTPVIAEIEQTARISEDVLRYLTIRVDE